jgi:hypothetical protein
MNRMKWHRWNSIAVSAVLLVWSLFAWWNMERRIVSLRDAAHLGLLLILLAGLISGLWRVVLLGYAGAFLGGIEAARVNGNGLDDIMGMSTGLVMGGILGLLWHEWRRFREHPNDDEFCNFTRD